MQLDDEEAAFEQRIDYEWLAAESFRVAHCKGSRPAQPKHSPLRRNSAARSPAQAKHSALSRNSAARSLQLKTSIVNRGVQGDDRRSWCARADAEDGSSPQPRSAVRLQKSIEDLERKIALATMDLTCAERKVAQRKLSIHRQVQSARKMGWSPTTPPTPPMTRMDAPSPGQVPRMDLPSPGQPRACSDVPHDATTAAYDDPTMAGLAIVVSTLASTPTAASPSSPAPARPFDTLLLGSVSRQLRSSFLGCEWKRKVDAAVHLQRVQRGHAARLDTSERAKAQADLVKDFLQTHGAHDWQRTPSSSDLQALVLPQLVMGSRLAAGSHGCVYQPKKPVWHFPKGGIAVKAASLQSTEASRGLALEASLLRRVVEALGPHPNVVGLHSTFLADGHARLALDLALGDLHDHMWRRRGHMPQLEALDFARQLACGLRHLHRAGVAHRDLKLGNALLCPSGIGDGIVVKLADLGLGVHSSQLESLASVPSELRHELRGALLGVTHEQVGTETTMAPEVVAGQWYCPYTADAWSLGICILALLAPRDVDEYEFDRTPFYPFLVADPDVDPEYAMYEYATFRVSRARGRSPPSATGTGLPLPPGLAPGFGPAPPTTTMRPPGLPAAAPTRLENGAAAAARSPTARLIERRAIEDGHAMPAPPLAPELLQLMDGLLTPAAGFRMSVADAARRLRYDLCVAPA